MEANSSQAKFFAFRLQPHQDLKKAILDFGKVNHIKAGTIVSCVGSLEQYHLRFARKKEGVKLPGHFEIVSLTGTFNESSCHLHISVSDHEGKTIGGHLLEGNLIYTTAEIVVANLTGLKFERKLDSYYGYQELIVSSQS